MGRPKSLVELVVVYHLETNPVTKSVRRDILAKRLAREYID